MTKPDSWTALMDELREYFGTSGSGKKVALTKWLTSLEDRVDNLEKKVAIGGKGKDPPPPPPDLGQ